MLLVKRARQGRRRLAEIMRLHFAIEFVDALDQFVEFLAAGHAEFAQRARYAIFEYLFELVPGFLGALAHLGHAGFDRAAHFVDLAGRDLARLLLRGSEPSLHQRFEQLAAFALRLGEGAEAGQPDLLRRFHDRFAGNLAGIAGCCRGFDFSLAFAMSLPPGVASWLPAERLGMCVKL